MHATEIDQVRRRPPDNRVATRGADGARDPRRPAQRARVPVTSVTVSDPGDFGRWLIARMAALGLTPADLSRATGIDASLISKWRRGEAQPSLANLRRLAPAHQTPFVELAAVAGHNESSDVGGKTLPRPPAAHPLVLDVARLLGEDSPLPQGERELLEELIGRIIAPYRRRRRAS